MAPHHILAIDAGTSSIRAIVYSKSVAVHTTQREIHSNCDARGWVEQDPTELWDITVDVCRQAIFGAGLAPNDIIAIGIANRARPRSFGTVPTAHLYIRR